MNRRTRTARRIAAGTRRLGRRYGDGMSGWVRQGETGRGRALRLGCLLLLAAVVVRAASSAPAVLWLLTGWWCLASYRAGAGARPEAAADTSPETPADVPAAPGPGAVLALLDTLIGDRSGVHLSTVLQHLQQHGHGDGRAVSDLRDQLAALGVPARRSVKVAGRVTWGVRRADLPPPSPTDAPVLSTSPSTAA